MVDHAGCPGDTGVLPQAAPSRPRPRRHPRAALQPSHREGVRWVDQALHLLPRQAPPGGDGRARGRRFLTSLAIDGRVAASTQNQALNALLFMYRVVLEVDLPWLDDVVRARRPESLPTVLTRDEVRRVLECLEGTPRVIVLLLYGAGLRLLESAQLRITDIDFATNQLVVRSGKGAKDRDRLPEEPWPT